jgi:hypothetical protein
VHHRGKRRIGGHRTNGGIEVLAARAGGQHRIKGRLIGQLQPRGLETLGAQPPFMGARPCLAAVIDDALAQQQLGQPMPRPHQVFPAVLPGPHQIARGFLLDRGDRHLHDLAHPQQPRQMPGIADIGFDPIPGRAHQL